MPGFNNDLKFDPLTPMDDLYDVITQNGPVPETFTYQKKIAHGPIYKNQSSNSGGGNRFYGFIVSTRTNNFVTNSKNCLDLFNFLQTSDLYAEFSF